MIPLLLAALVIPLLLLVPGLLLALSLLPRTPPKPPSLPPSPPPSPHHSLPQSLNHLITQSLSLGLLAHLLVALLLLSVARWTPVLHSLLLLLLCIPAALRAARRPLPLPWLPLAAAAATLSLLLAAVFLLPAASEWIAGGWDPGIYTDNALAISRTGTLHPVPSAFHAALPPDLLPLFAERTLGPYRECLPGVPLAPDGSHPLFFFPLTSVFGALLHRLAGLPALFRMNAVLAVLLLFPLAGFLARLLPARPRAAAVLAVVLALLSPPFWYLQNVPTSEFLYLFLLLSAVNAWLDARSAPSPSVPAGLLPAAALFLLAVAHLNSAVLVAALLALAALLERTAPRPGARLRILSALAALVLGALWDVAFARPTVLKLVNEFSNCSVLVAAFLSAASLAVALLFLPPPSPRLRRPALRILRAAALLFALAMAVTAVASLIPAARAFFQNLRLPVLDRILWWMMRLSALASVPAVLLAAAGLASLALRPRPPAPLAAAAFAFLSVFALLLYMPGIACLLPWALRRFFPFAFPALILLQTAALLPLLHRLSPAPRSSPPVHRLSFVLCRLSFLALLLLALIPARQSLSARRAGDYPGLASAISAVLPHLRPGDTLVADSPVFATPLLLAQGVDVVNGRLLWDCPDPALRSARLSALRTHAPSRILFLTSDPDGLDIYPDPLPFLSPVPLLDLPLTLSTVHHASRQSRYETRSASRRLRLYPPLP